MKQISNFTYLDNVFYTCIGLLFVTAKVIFIQLKILYRNHFDIARYFFLFIYSAIRILCPCFNSSELKVMICVSALIVPGSNAA